VTYWKFDRKEGRIDVKKSFSLELPPYSQDLSDAGKLGSDGWSSLTPFVPSAMSAVSRRAAPL